LLQLFIKDLVNATQNVVKIKCCFYQLVDY
jgi:hypothetical protein